MESGMEGSRSMDPTPDGAGFVGHPELDQLADADEGLLDGDLAAAVEGHVAGCAVCQARVAALLDVAAALRALPDPELPPALAERLTAAIRAEPATDPAQQQPTLTVLADRREQRAQRARALSVAAATVVVLAGIGFAVAHPWAQSQGDSGGSSGGQAAAGSAAGPGPAIHHTGVNYTATSLKAAVPGLLRSTALPSSQSMTEDVVPQGGQARQAAPRDLTRTQLTACTRNLGLPDGALLAVDYARYQGRPRVVLVYPGQAPRQVEVFVVPSTCASAGAGLIPTAVIFAQR
jgi:hypothetical protein